MRSDAELLDAWRTGDNRAGNELVDRHFAEISRFFRNKVASEDDATDLVSQTFLGCTVGKDRYRGDASVRQFLFSIARNVLYKYIRGRYKQSREQLDFAEVCVQHTFPASLSSIVMHRREAQCFVQALREIPIDDQIVLELMYFEGLSGTEIAAALELPEGTIRGRIARGKQRLRERIDALLVRGAHATGASFEQLDAWAREVRVAQGWERGTPP
jgi:RNA polymerase sigma-70 factor, ECF subfamily